MKEIAGGEDVAPGDFAAVGHDHADDAFALETGSGAGEAALDFFDVVIGGVADGAGLVDFLIGLRWRVVGDRPGNLRGGEAGRRDG